MIEKISIALLVIAYYSIGVTLLKLGFSYGFDKNIGIVSPLLFMLFLNLTLGVQLSGKKR
jgi:lipopolysaccharide export LptBFGC system permease protein LptF